MPRVAIRAAEQALEWKKFPQRMPANAYFDLPNRVRASLARLIGAAPEETAITTGASAGLAAVAHGIDWKREDEVLVARGEFPAHFATWLPLQAAGALKVTVVSPRGRFITADDFLERIGPRTRLVSTSLARFDDSALLDAAGLARACHGAGALLLLDVAQCAGAMPIDARALGADFITGAGYKWLLSPYGTGFFWAPTERIEQMRPGPCYWTAIEGADKFHTLSQGGYRLGSGAGRFDAPETASFFNLSAMAASLEFLLRVGVEPVREHTQRLAAQVIERLPRDRFVLASPAAAGRRGPSVCIAARKAEDTAALFERLREAHVYVSLREGALRIAPHLYNSERDIDRMLAILSA